MIPRPLLDDLVDRALGEDLSGGDLTTEATIEAGARSVAQARAKSELVACGGEVFARVFERLDPRLSVGVGVSDGTRCQPGQVLWTVRGSTRSILMGERTALNFVQRMSGIATLTRRYADALPEGTTTRITDTRKTTPGLRILERYAVRTGGGHNHRDTLGAAVLIKDNHILAAGGIRAAIERARLRAPHTSRIEVEVEDLEALDEALDAEADIVMLDNFDPSAVAEAVRRARGRAMVEASGNLDPRRVAELARAGVGALSIGALTHSAPAADISLDFTAEPAERT